MITALHGFLGLPGDWDFLGADVVTPPLDAIPDEGDTLLGYSLGGRLALQALLRGARYRRAVIVSTRVRDAEPDRRERDERWARRFESDDWETLMRDWNAQPLFGGHAMPRQESDFDRRELARQLREWSPAVLPPVESRLHEIATPVLWIAGGRDAQYVADAQRAESLLPASTLAIVPHTAHRVPWERSAEFAALLREFVSR